MADGRLGNQIFQYMFLKTISKKNERIICLNMKMLFKSFDFDKHIIWHSSDKYVCLLIQKIIIPLLLRPLSKVRIINYIEQKKDLNLRPLPDWREKKGLFSYIRYVNTDFFQSEIFFNQSQINISNLQIKGKYLTEARQFLSEISDNYTKVFVHIRRGDYIRESFMEERGIDLPKYYFENAINLIKEKIKNPFFIFLSDDPSYIECCFQEIEPKIISKKSMQVDLAIMTLCKAGVISNSSFSWWGAYLMNERNLVIAPKYWYGWKKKIESHPGIQPSFSIIIDVNKDKNHWLW
ncbi:alpha-1,2-fucosyltransferase [Methanosarcina vacuolata]|uniref:alpha-1,2-fucosyltransferase n=1 Tax=Methanosarcina vacuolata TaxID=2215 RepID=UPI0018DB8613|nr:alpha-1,2-fucosyltransferase [Methanosarcina vacuolata]